MKKLFAVVLIVVLIMSIGAMAATKPIKLKLSEVHIAGYRLL
ncbi:MAG TPA: hypothetical protein PLC07_11040 [Bacillota bacterium]|nr:hypothetical protein [Bacillota bacterium]HPT87837.1 hypothetical protein [Bacillota bacterium]